MSRNEQLFERAKAVIPGGVNSPVRAFGAVGGTPRFFARGQGKTVTDADGRQYLDLVGSWGPLILGHAHQEVLNAAREAMEQGTTFGAPTEAEVLLAEAVRRHLPSVEKLRLVSSGTEATMSALRLARGFTGRPKVVKFTGCYHGHADSFLVKAGSGVATFNIPGTPGVTEGTVADTLLAEYNDLGSVQALFATHGQAIAAVIVEPVAGNMGVVPPAPGFLEGLREVTRAHGALLIFDEVITGFRLGLGGAQGRFGVTPDLTTLGKILGGGFPLGAFGGRADVMDKLAPVGPVYQAGTLSGNPVATAAGLKTLEILARPGTFEGLEETAAHLAEGLAQAASRAGVPHRLNRVGSMMTLFFTDREVRDWDSAATCDTARYGRFFHGMLDRGVYLPPAQFEAFFVNVLHDRGDVERVVQAAATALRQAQQEIP
jgi:glutamate-1-semialdehyde 2,1-aminomutase